MMHKSLQMCANCRHCRYISHSTITGHAIDFVCILNGSILDDVSIKWCDELWEYKEEVQE